MNRGLRYDKLYMDIAYRVAEMSYAKRKRVGAVIVKDDNIISFGFNGTPAGFDNCCEDQDGNTLPEVIHAERNAIYKLARTGESSEGATLYLTHSPCLECALAIIQARFKEVIYDKKYDGNDGIPLILRHISIYSIKDIEKEEEDYQRLMEEEKKPGRDSVMIWENP